MIVQFVSGIILLTFIAGVMLAAAIAVGWPMAAGMGFVFFLEFIRRATHNT